MYQQLLIGEVMWYLDSARHIEAKFIPLRHPLHDSNLQGEGGTQVVFTEEEFDLRSRPDFPCSESVPGNCRAAVKSRSPSMLWQSTSAVLSMPI